MQYTPAPWKCDDGRLGALYIRGPRNWLIAEIYGATRTERKANARLVTAAPELLEACKEILKCDAIDHHSVGSKHAWDTVREAVKKAENG